VKRYLFILEVKSPFLTKRARVTDLFVHSDTWSAAILSVAASTGVDVDAWGEPWFRVSSTLPVLRDGDGGWTLFYPMPEPLRDAIAGGKDRKSAKAILYADAGFLRSRGRSGHALLDRDGKLRLDAQSGAALAWVSIRTGLAVDRLSGGPIEDQLFEVGDVLVDPRLALGLLVEAPEDRVQEFERFLRLLGFSGVGASRTRGRGQFEWTERLDFEPPKFGSGAHLLLSLYHPTREEVQAGVLDGSWYRLVQRGGFVTSPGAMTLRRDRVTMLAEGAVIGSSEPPRGDVVEVLARGTRGSRNRVVRDGRAFAIPIAMPDRGGGA